jgi:hypothetical protein
MPSEEDVRALMPPDNPYDFGFLPAMARLQMAHPRLGPGFGMQFAQIMFEPGFLTREGRRRIVDCFSART